MHWKLFLWLVGELTGQDQRDSGAHRVSLEMVQATKESLPTDNSLICGGRAEHIVVPKATENQPEDAESAIFEEQ